MGSVGGLSALAIIIATFYKNPLQNIRASLNALRQIDVSFSGTCGRSIKSDATFKHMFLDAKDFGTKQMKEPEKKFRNPGRKVWNKSRVTFRANKTTFSLTGLAKQPPRQIGFCLF